MFAVVEDEQQPPRGEITDHRLEDRTARQLLDAAAGYRFEAAVVMALAYGMRRGEVLGLHWSALDWKAGRLGVTHGVKRVKNRDVSSGRRIRLVAREVKTPKSRRVLALTPEMVAMFRQHRVRQAEAQMAAGVATGT